MSYFLGEGEARHMPLPDVVCVAGPYPFRLLKEGGNPVEKLRLTGSLRYSHLLSDDGDRSTRAFPGPAPLTEILVAVPVDVWAARHLLAAIQAAFPTGGREEGLRFHIRIHPSNADITLEDVPFPAQESQPDLYKALGRCGLVIYTGSSIGVEAAALGRTVLHYHPELLLDMDPGELYEDRIPMCTDGSLRQAVLKLVQEGSRPEPLDPRELFTPVNWEALEAIFRPENAPASSVAGAG
jgi:hypothetical protein